MKRKKSNKILFAETKNIHLRNKTKSQMNVTVTVNNEWVNDFTHLRTK